VTAKLYKRGSCWPDILLTLPALVYAQGAFSADREAGLCALQIGSRIGSEFRPELHRNAISPPPPSLQRLLLVTALPRVHRESGPLSSQKRPRIASIPVIVNGKVSIGAPLRRRRQIP
jgi:hypothetical protein